MRSTRVAFREDGDDSGADLINRNGTVTSRTAAVRKIVISSGGSVDPLVPVQRGPAGVPLLGEGEEAALVPPEPVADESLPTSTPRTVAARDRGQQRVEAVRGRH